jgi:hypothetical protein
LPFLNDFGAMVKQLVHPVSAAGRRRFNLKKKPSFDRFCRNVFGGFPSKKSSQGRYLRYEPAITGHRRTPGALYTMKEV